MAEMCGAFERREKGMIARINELEAQLKGERK